MAHGEIYVQLSVNFADDPKVRALARYGRDARRARDLYVQMICYCKQNLTDGLVPAEQIGILVYPDPLKIGMKDAERLAEVGLIEHRGDAWYVVGFLKRNRSREAVRDRAEEKKRAGAKANHIRWHVERDVTKPDCEWCQAGSGPDPKSDPDGTPDGDPTGLHIGHRSEDIGHRSETETVPSDPKSDPPPPSPPPTGATPPDPAGAPEEGDDSGHTIDELDVIRQVRELRPDWTTASITRALNRPEVLERPAALRPPAMLAVARDPDSQHPGRLAHDGPWWHTRPAPAPRPPWCGDCDPQTRLIDDDTAVRRCPNCHPLRDQEAS